MLSSQQKIQEDEYALPYHWFKDRGTTSGRLYFGYQDICLGLIEAIPRGATILDAGCGDGRFLGALHEKGFSNLHGTDYSERAIEFARLLAPYVKMTVADLSNLPYEDDFFDVIFMIETLEHIIPENIPQIVDNFRRILKPGGRIIITVPSKNAPLSPGSKHYQHFTSDSLSQYFTDGFLVKQIIGQDKVGFSLYKVVYSLLDNRFWDFKRIRKYYNKNIWPKRFNNCEPQFGRRLIIECEKKK